MADRWLVDLGTALVVAIAIAIGQLALDGHGRLAIRVIVVVGVSVLTYGASYLALAALLDGTPPDPGPWLAWPPTELMIVAILVAETVIWMPLMLLSGRRRAERQGRFHPEHRIPFQKPFDR